MIEVWKLSYSAKLWARDFGKGMEKRIVNSTDTCVETLLAIRDADENAENCYLPVLPPTILDYHQW